MQFYLRLVACRLTRGHEKLVTRCSCSRAAASSISASADALDEALDRVEWLASNACVLQAGLVVMRRLLVVRDCDHPRDTMLLFALMDVVGIGRVGFSFPDTSGITRHPLPRQKVFHS